MTIINLLKARNLTRGSYNSNTKPKDSKSFIVPSLAATTRRDFRTRRDFFASMETAFEHGNGLKSRLVVAVEDGIGVM